MGPTWPFVHIFKSRIERYPFVILRHLMVTCIPRVDGLSTDPSGLRCLKFNGIERHYFCFL